MVLVERAISLFNSSEQPVGAEGEIVQHEGETFKSPGYVWDELGESLRSTVWRGRTGFVQELLALGADPNYRTVYCGWRPIHYAAWNDYPKIISMLVEAGADMNARTEYGETPLHLAAVKASNEAIKQLLAGGADSSLRHVQVDQRAQPAVVRVTYTLSYCACEL